MKQFLLFKRFIFPLFFYGVNAFSQSIPIKEVLVQKEKSFGVFFMFDSDLIENIPFQGNLKTDSLSIFLQQFEINSAFKIEKKDEKHYLIIPKEKGKNYLLKGEIVDKITKQPQINAIIGIKKQNQFVFSNAKGEYEKLVSYVPNDTVEIRFVGYYPIKIPMIEMQNNGIISMQEDEKLQKLNTVEITGYVANGISLVPLKNKIAIKYTNMELLPGQTDGDILTTLDAMPGINSIDSKPGNLNVRGSTADQSLILLNDIPIYKRGHLFGAVSNIAPSIIDQVDIYRNSYDAEIGGRVGGTIKVNSDMKILNRSKANFYTSMIDASGYYSLPIIKNKLNMSICARTSYPFGNLNPKLGVISNFLFIPSELSTPSAAQPGIKHLKYELGYRDFNYGLIWKISPKHTFDLHLLYSKDGVESSFFVDNTIRKNNRIPYIKLDKLLFENIGIGTHLYSQLNSKWSSVVKFIFSSYEQDFIGETKNSNNNQFLGSNYTQNKVYDIHGGIQAQYNSKNDNKFTLGYETRHFQVINTEKITIHESDFFLATILGNNLTKDAFLHTLFGNYQWNEQKKWKFNTGLRLNYYNLSNSLTAEPRLGINYLFSKNLIAKASAGIHKQFITQMLAASMETLDGVDAQIWSLTDDKNVKILTGYQANTGIIFRKKEWVLDIDLYYKYTTEFSALNRFSIYETNKYIHGDIDLLGADLYLKKSFKNIHIWASYTCNISNMNFPDVRSFKFPSIFTNTHSVDLSVSYKLKNLRIAASLKVRSGLFVLDGLRVPLTIGYNGPNNFIYSNPGVPANPPRVSAQVNQIDKQLSDETFPIFHQLDVSAMYDIPVKSKLKPYIGFSIINIYNQKNTIARFRSPNGSTDFKYSLGFNFNFILGIRF